MSGFKAFRVHRDEGGVHGELETITLNDLSDGDVVIRAAYSGVNYKDALAATGKGKIMRHFPMVGGVDVSGHVESSSSPLLEAGQPVIVAGFGLSEAHDGGFSERVRVPAEWVVPLPSGLTLREAMVLGTAGLTVGLAVHQMERMGQIPDLGPILVTGSTGGVGSLAVDILSARGYEVHALTGKTQAADYLSKLGATEVVLQSELDFGSRPLESTRFGGALDNVGGDVLAWLTRTVAPLGNIASIGLAGGSGLNTTVMPFILRGVNLLGINSVLCPADLKHEVWTRLGRDLKPQHVDLIGEREVSLDQLSSVFEDYIERRVTGRTVVAIDSSV